MKDEDDSPKSYSQKQLLAFLFGLLLVGGLALAWTLRDELSGSRQPEAYQAFFAFLGLFPTLAVMVFGIQAEGRAQRAEAKAALAEANSQLLHAAALSQSAAMERMAESTQQQLHVLLAERDQSRQLNLALVRLPETWLIVGESARYQAKTFHSLANFSQFPVMIESVELLGMPSKAQRVPLRKDLGGATTEFAMLQPGDHARLELDEARRLSDESEPTRKRVGGGIEYALWITAVSPVHGRTRTYMALRFQDHSKESPAQVISVRSEQVVE